MSMLRSTFLCGLLLAFALSPASAQAQKKRVQSDAELIARLHEMTRAKGIYALRLGPDFCRRLGSRPMGLCEAFQAEFSDGGKVKAAFYSLNDKRKNALHLFITSYLEPSYVDDYRVGLDGKLERAVRRRGEASSRVSVIDATPGFKRAMEFLHGKQEQLAELPDAKLVDDGSCPQGKVKRVPRDPKLAVCLDRARLDAQAR
jgi:hypothetical protein